jgi:hypothetical protein
MAKAPNDKEQLQDGLPALSVNSKVSRPSKKITLRYTPTTGATAQTPDAVQPDANLLTGGQLDNVAEEKECDLSCLSPSARLRLAAEISTKSTGEPPGSLLEEYYAVGRDKYCKCGKPKPTYARPRGVEAATSKNSGVRAREARRAASILNGTAECRSTNNPKERERETASSQARFARSATPSPEAARAWAARSRTFTGLEAYISESPRAHVATSVKKCKSEDDSAF